MRDKEPTKPRLAGVHVGEESKGLSRGEVILGGALVVGAAYGAASIAPFVGRALAKSDGGDVGILNFALTIEYLESAFYEEAKGRVKGSGELMGLIDLLAGEEEEHVGALTETIRKLGGKPVAEPKFDFPYGNTKEFLELAQTFEDTGVSAYIGVAPQIRSKEVLRMAGAIAQVEARHAAAIRLQNGEEPAPEGFDFPQGKASDLKTIEPFIQ